jgi:hypothetical protein
MNTSDLIYLFIDGEATEIERQILFEKLANNNELQLEFQDALKINQNIASNENKLAPTAFLTNSIFSQAGLTQVLTTSAVVTTGASVSSSLFNESLAFLNTKLAVGLASAFVSLILSVGLTSLFFNLDNKINPEKNEAIIKKTNIPISYSQIIDSQNDTLELLKSKLAQFENANTLRIKQNVTKDLSKESSKEASREIKQNLNSISILNTENLNLRNKIAKLENDLVKYQNGDISNNNLNAIDKNIDNNSNFNSNYILKEINNLNLSKYNKIENQDSLNKINNELNLRNNSIYFQNINLNNGEIFKSINNYIINDEKETNFLLDYRSISGLEYFPQRITEENKDNRFNNFSINGVLKVSDGLFVGLSGGQEDFPVYVISKGNFRYQNSLLWIALTGRYYINSWNFSNFSPFIETSFGGTQIGPLNKSVLGLSWEPIKNVNFNVAAESTNILFSNSNNNIRSAGKLGLMYGITFKF